MDNATIQDTYFALCTLADKFGGSHEVGDSKFTNLAVICIAAADIAMTADAEELPEVIENLKEALGEF